MVHEYAYIFYESIWKSVYSVRSTDCTWYTILYLSNA